MSSGETELYDGAVAIIRIDGDLAWLQGPNGARISAKDQVDLADMLMNCVAEYGHDAIDLARAREQQKIRDKIEETMARGTGHIKVAKRSIYLMEAGGNYKVGVSKNAEQRLEQVRRHQPFAMLIAVSRPLSHPFRLEAAIHEALSKRNIVGEWFRLSEEEANAIAKHIVEAKDRDE